MKKKLRQIRTDSGEQVQAVAPLILTVSRSTDIPAFYADWFFERLKRGYLVQRNPFNNRKSYIALEDVRLIVFFSKNPAPLLSRLSFLKERGIHCYVHFTLNDYEKERWEPGLPGLEKRLEVFYELAGELGPEKVIWRFDPLLLSERLDVEELVRRAGYIGDRLQGSTKKMVFSFADILRYRNVKNNLKKTGEDFREFDGEEMLYWAEQLSLLNRNWGYLLASCGETVNLEKYGIAHNKCIDDELIIRLFPEDRRLMEEVGAVTGGPGLFGIRPSKPAKSSSDAGQRECCRCIPSRSIGAYNTCPHLCVYCYANHTPVRVMENYRLYLNRSSGEELIVL